MTKLTTATLTAVLITGGLFTACSSGDATNTPPVPTTAATDANGNNAKLVIPGDLIGKNAQVADDEIRKTGFVNIKYGSTDTTVSVDPAHLADWTVTKVDPAGGSLAQSNDNIVITVAKQ
ncbi:MAG: hypothetical protein ACRDRO_08180 [Pseudonocardiaceae bacterium]